jgi:prepilin-type processing-associated H-X9-DG protein
MFINHYHAVQAHGDGLNVGYTDGSAQFLSGDLRYEETRTFFEALFDWQPAPTNPISPAHHIEAFEFFDTK